MIHVLAESCCLTLTAKQLTLNAPVFDTSMGYNLTWLFICSDILIVYGCTQQYLESVSDSQSNAYSGFSRSLLNEMQLFFLHGVLLERWPGPAHLNFCFSTHGQQATCAGSIYWAICVMSHALKECKDQQTPAIPAWGQPAAVQHTSRENSSWCKGMREGMPFNCIQKTSIVWQARKKLSL